MQCSQISLMLVKSFSFLQELKILYDLRFKTSDQKKIIKNLKEKVWEITLIATKICYFAYFAIFDDISGFRQSEINLLTHLLFSVDKLQKQKLYSLSSSYKFQSWTLRISRMVIFSGTFYKPEPNQSLEFGKTCAFIYGTLLKNQILYFFSMQNRPKYRCLHCVYCI